MGVCVWVGVDGCVCVGGCVGVSVGVTTCVYMLV